MKGCIYLLTTVFLFSFCGSRSEGKKEAVQKAQKSQAEDTLPMAAPDTLIDTVALAINFYPGTNYVAVKSRSVSVKNSVKNSPDSLKKEALENLILNELIPYWYKTPWDFNGYTDTPQQGVIACGYFVSTVLKHAGFNVNRYKLAQQDPLNEAKSVAANDTVAVYEVNAEQLQKIFKEQYPEGLYFVGLDFHVGFLLFRNEELFFIHSNYINAEGVIFEKALLSDAFNAAGAYRIAPLSTNASLLAKWVKSEEVKVITSR